MDNSAEVMEAAAAAFPTIESVYRELCVFEETAAWAALTLLTYRENLSDGDAEGLHHLFKDMAEDLDREALDGGYGGAFYRDILTTVELLEELIDLCEEQA